MQYLYEIVTYALQRVSGLLFSMSVDGVSIGALMVGACLLMIVFRALVGLHLSVFSNERRVEETEEEAIERGIRNRRIAEKVDERAGPRKTWHYDKRSRSRWFG